MQSAQKLLLITAPFTQLNTPYPATMYLKCFLNTKGYESYQADLGLEVILELFSKKGLSEIFELLEDKHIEISENAFRIHQLQEEYISTIDAVIEFLQNKNPSLAHLICDGSFLPEASRFSNTEDLSWAFGTMGIQDKARHLCTLYLEDLGDFIKETIDPYFGFSRYAERLGSTASSFDELEEQLKLENSLISNKLLELLDQKIKHSQATVVCLSIPFPGNLFASLKCGQFIKENYPHIKVVIGGGYVNTELRSISDSRIFSYLDYISLDDGEAALLSLLQHLQGELDVNSLKRIFVLEKGQVVYKNNKAIADIAQKDTGTPDYEGLLLDRYLSVIELANPMHRLWSDGRWNKLTLAHGCYWGKCSFCDISLDYIKRYEPLTASLICDRMEALIRQTGQNGFHFVDEAAPPNLLRALALEILHRKLIVSWWTNIRFEKHFSSDLAYLLKASGCIAVAGGLEVASDRLLKLMKKGVSLNQVAQVADALTQAGIMVHAYLMYGFPTESEQETIDALEIVRQLFENQVLHSGFWHRFAMTAHSPVGLNPEAYSVKSIGPKFEGFADNDRHHEDSLGAEHDKFSEGLKISLFNYMHGLGLEENLQTWFQFKVPKPSISKNFILHCLSNKEEKYKHVQHIYWIGKEPLVSKQRNGKKEELNFEFFTKKNSFELRFDIDTGLWLEAILTKINLASKSNMNFDEFKQDYAAHVKTSFDKFWSSKQVQTLRSNGLLLL
ncbi:MAG: radical SAM protein [Chitinophagales bacterium]|nr:radical SAM protein [Chitinophagales bacterium]